MKLIIVFFLIVSSAFATVTESFQGEDVVINGLRVSARKHWNFRAYATPDFKFCKFMGFSEADRSQTVVVKVAPQRMVFFTALLSENPDGIVTLEEESKMLEKVICIKP